MESFGGNPEYSCLKELPSKELDKYDNVVFIMVDGLGYEYVKRKAKGSFLEKHTTAKLTSVFPASTTGAVTSMVTGVAPLQHAFSEWFIYLKENKDIMISLPFISLTQKSCKKLKIKDVIKSKSIFSKIKGDKYFVIQKEYSKSQFSRHISEGSKIKSFETLNQMSETISNLINVKNNDGKDNLNIKKTNKRKFILAYWDKFDSLSHKFGINSVQVATHYMQIDNIMKKMTKKLKGTNTKIIITADHGLVNSSKNNKIGLFKYEKINECLKFQITGGERVTFAHVKNSKKKQFEKYLKLYFGKSLDFIKSEDAIKLGLFGKGKIARELKDRIGDYVLIPKNNYSCIRKKNEQSNVGVHGGLSKWEMFVPLIEINLFD
jgi:hypothetical protein